MERVLVVLALGLFLTGCSSTYIGNVGFTTREICSEEYVLKTLGHSVGFDSSIGCLPP